MVTSIKKHIVPAYYNWLRENDPKVFINLVMEVPDVFIQPYPGDAVFSSVVIETPDGKNKTLTLLTLNTNFEAVSNFAMTPDCFAFNCRMSGNVTSVLIPYEAVISLYCPDSKLSKDFGFDLSSLEETPGPMAAEGNITYPTHVAPFLKVVDKDDTAAIKESNEDIRPKPATPSLTIVK